MGADPIASAAISDPAGRDLLAFFVRKEKKQHGLQRWVEGPLLEEGTPVLIVEDVVTTGGSTVKAIERCLEEGLGSSAPLRSSTAWPEAPRRSRRPAARLIRRLATIDDVYREITPAEMLRFASAFPGPLGATGREIL